MSIVKIKRLLGGDLRRALFSWRFVAAALGIFLFLTMMGLVMAQTSSDLCALCYFVSAGSSIALIIYCLLPTIPYSYSYLSDHHSNAIRYWTVRGGVNEYIGSKFVATFFSGMAAYLVGITLFMLAFSTKVPLLTENEPSISGGYVDLLYAGKPGLYLACLALHHSLTAGMFACLAFSMSAVFPNLFLAMVSPIVLDFIYLRIGNLVPIPGWMKETAITQSAYDMGSTGLTLLTKAGVTLGILALAYVLAFVMIRRRFTHE